MAGPDRLGKLARQLEDITTGAAQKRIVTAAGVAGKNAALEAVSRDLGGDRSFSGMRRKAKLGVGFEVEGFAARMNFRPAGLWVLAESGRKSSGRIYPRSGSRKGRRPVAGRAVRTPMGFRATSSYARSRGLDTFSDGVKQVRQVVPETAFKAIAAEIRKLG